jgi:integrase/recombinase XerD
MPDKNKTIINYIPYFLEYCKIEKNLLPKTIKSYDIFLRQFTTWLKISNLFDMSPEKFFVEYAEKYRDYLSKQINDRNQQIISKKTQNYYLISLRALLTFFVEKNIKSLSPIRVRLLKEDKKILKNKFLNSEKIELILKSTNISTIMGLRDRAILEILFFDGLKVGQVVNLDKNYINKYTFSKKSIKWLNKYLKTRQKDKEKALFINYKGPKNKSSRLSARSIENIVKKYVTKSKLSISLSPEDLRNIFIVNLFDQNNKIKISNQIFNHGESKIDFYNPERSEKDKKMSKITPCFSWNIVESNINKEIKWLKNNIFVLHSKHKQNKDFMDCQDCLLRKIAILIVSGKVKTTKFKITQNKKLWDISNVQNIKIINKHGQEWHRKMMTVVSKYFENKNYKIRLEPNLNYGRADLGVYSRQNPKEFFYIEIGTVSIYKLWYNFSTMKNAIFLIIPFEEYFIEFRTELIK